MTGPGDLCHLCSLRAGRSTSYKLFFDVKTLDGLPPRPAPPALLANLPATSQAGEDGLVPCPELIPFNLGEFDKAGLLQTRWVPIDASPPAAACRS